MAKLTKADAARHLGIARSTLYKWIAQGTISATPDGMIDQAELVRVAVRGSRRGFVLRVRRLRDRGCF